MPALVIYTEHKSPRLTYVLDWIFPAVLHIDYILVHNKADIPSGAFVISYGEALAGVLSIPATGLLQQQNISKEKISTGSWQGLPVLFHSGSEAHSLSFDIFSAIFFLLSRYEEYYPFTPDKHGRYPATDSILFQLGLLRRPIVDEWLLQFCKLLKNSGLDVAAPEFSFRPTYDIDIAWSYRHKGFARNAGGFLKDLSRGNLAAATERLRVLAGSAPDPFDSFTFIRQLHETQFREPLFFILAALKATPHDKNISPVTPAMQRLLQELSAYGRIGMHPSYYSDNDTKAWNDEREILARATGQSINISRQHYIRFHLPATYRFLQEQGITDDHSMGYGTYLGFRAGTGRSFPWYDLEAEKANPLIIHPFCFMDSTAHYEEGLDANNAFTLLNEMRNELVKTGSCLTTVFHNFSLGTAVEWKGWPEKYAQFVASV